MRFSRRKTTTTGGTPAVLVDRPFLDEMRAVEKLLPIPPNEINRLVLDSRLDEADLDAAERLNRMNLRHFEVVVRPVMDEWMREVRARRTGQAWAFAASCALIAAGCVVRGVPSYFLFFIGTFGFATAVSAWYGGRAAAIGARLAEKVLRRAGGSSEVR